MQGRPPRAVLSVAQGPDPGGGGAGSPQARPKSFAAGSATVSPRPWQRHRLQRLSRGASRGLPRALPRGCPAGDPAACPRVVPRVAPRAVVPRIGRGSLPRGPRCPPFAIGPPPDLASVCPGVSGCAPPTRKVNRTSWRAARARDHRPSPWSWLGMALTPGTSLRAAPPLRRGRQDGRQTHCARGTGRKKRCKNTLRLEAPGLQRAALDAPPAGRKFRRTCPPRAEFPRASAEEFSMRQIIGGRINTLE